MKSVTGWVLFLLSPSDNNSNISCKLDRQVQGSAKGLYTFMNEIFVCIDVRTVAIVVIVPLRNVHTY